MRYVCPTIVGVLVFSDDVCWWKYYFGSLVRELHVDRDSLVTLALKVVDSSLRAFDSFAYSSYWIWLDIDHMVKYCVVVCNRHVGVAVTLESDVYLVSAHEIDRLIVMCNIFYCIGWCVRPWLDVQWFGWGEGGSCRQVHPSAFWVVHCMMWVAVGLVI